MASQQKPRNGFIRTQNVSNIIVRPYTEVSVDFDDSHDELGSCDMSESISRTLCVLVILATMFSGHESLLLVQEGLSEMPPISDQAAYSEDGISSLSFC
jgi:hypothetical protein